MFEWNLGYPPIHGHVNGDNWFNGWLVNVLFFFVETYVVRAFSFEGFPEIWVSQFLIGFSIMSHPTIGDTPMVWKPRIYDGFIPVNGHCPRGLTDWHRVTGMMFFLTIIEPSPYVKKTNHKMLFRNQSSTPDEYWWLMIVEAQVLLNHCFAVVMILIIDDYWLLLMIIDDDW